MLRLERLRTTKKTTGDNRVVSVLITDRTSEKRLDRIWAKLKFSAGGHRRSEREHCLSTRPNAAHTDRHWEKQKATIYLSSGSWFIVLHDCLNYDYNTKVCLCVLCAITSSHCVTAQQCSSLPLLVGSVCTYSVSLGQNEIFCEWKKRQTGQIGR